MYEAQLQAEELTEALEEEEEQVSEVDDFLRQVHLAALQGPGEVTSAPHSRVRRMGKKSKEVTS